MLRDLTSMRKGRGGMWLLRPVCHTVCCVGYVVTVPCFTSWLVTIRLFYFVGERAERRARVSVYVCVLLCTSFSLLFWVPVKLPICYIYFTLLVCVRMFVSPGLHVCVGKVTCFSFSPMFPQVPNFLNSLLTPSLTPLFRLSSSLPEAKLN